MRPVVRSLVAVSTVAIAALVAAPAHAESYYCNGQPATTLSGQVLYPNGQVVRDGFGTTYYPNGQVVVDSFRRVYYPNGQPVEDAFSHLYWPNGQVVRDSFGYTYYPNGQVARDSWGCYWSTGVQMRPCRTYTRVLADVPGFGRMIADLSMQAGTIGGIWGVHMVTAGNGVVTELDVNPFNGYVQNVTAICE